MRYESEEKKNLIFDLMNGSLVLDEVKDLYGFETGAIVSMAEVVEHLYNKECQGRILIDDKLKAAIDAYYEQYGVK